MYICGDCHEVIKDIENDSIDLIYNNPPFGTTENKWDTPLKWDMLFKELWRVLKPNGIIVIHAAKPFSYKLVQYETPKYNYTWKKDRSTGFLNAKKQPLRQTEEIYIFYKKVGTYNPQMVGNEKIRTGKAGKSNYYGSRSGNHDLNTYHYGKYPTDILEFKRKIRGGKTVPDEMIEFFIKTYSNEGDTVLDMTTHNKVVGNVVEKLKRKFIGIDLLEISSEDEEE